MRAGSFADKARGTRHQRGYGSAWDKIRERILQRDGGVCQPCLRHGLVHVGHAVDHIVPREQGGSDDDSNLQVICRPVHQAKTDAEKRGRVWDEAAWFNAHPAGARGHVAGWGGGLRISGATADRTDRFANFLRAQVSGVGGVNQGSAPQALAVGAVGRGGVA